MRVIFEQQIKYEKHDNLMMIKSNQIVYQVWQWWSKFVFRVNDYVVSKYPDILICN